MTEQLQPKELTGRIGKFDIVRPLGKGAMGMVYVAHDTSLERDVALKVMVSAIAEDPELKKRFDREAKAVARMTHPNVVTVYELGYHTDGSPYIAMELLKGQDLQKAMRTMKPPLSLDRKVTIIIQVLAGLAHAHKAGIVHRDIKPANIFLNEDGNVKIMDFGVARLTTASMTGTGNIVGTADYMSPEQVKGAHVDGRSDVFSVGCMLYELLAGRRPFHAENLMAIFYKITHDPADFTLLQGENPRLVTILQKALAKEAEKRYQTAYDFAVDLRDYLKANATSATGRHAVEALGDIEAPTTSAPTTVGEEVGATVVTDGPSLPSARTIEGGKSTVGAGPATIGPQETFLEPRGGRTASGATLRGESPTLREPSTRPPRPAAPVERRQPPPPAGSPWPWIAVAAIVAVVGVGGGIVWMQSRSQPVVAPPVTQPVVTAPPVTAPPPTVAPSVAAATPAPRFEPSEAPKTKDQPRGSASMRAAQQAFRDGKYDRAIEQGQATLKEDPSNAEAKKIVENSLQGQKAESHFQAAESALRAQDYDKAGSEADQGRSLAPWDPRGTDLSSRVQQARQRAQDSASQASQQRNQSQATALLAQADSALEAQKYDVAINLYDEVLKVDPNNRRAGEGRTGAITARAVAQAAGSVTKAPAGRSFIPNKTSASSPETRADSDAPAGFESTAGVKVKVATQAAELPGKINFEVEPSSVKPGDRYTVKIFLSNEGSAPIQVRDMLIATSINGRKTTGPVPPLTKDVAPQQKALVLQTSDLWKEDTTAWSMEVQVRTARGETYKNQLSWK